MFATFQHKCIILDACCIINLYASGRMEEVLKIIPKTILVAAYVKENETLRVYNGPPADVRQSTEILDLKPFVEKGLLTIAEIETDIEAEAFIQYATQLDDGEAITGAIAISRNWAIGTDEKKATIFFSQLAPDITIISTLELIKYWAETQMVKSPTLKETLLNIKFKANYEPSKNHPQYKWWLSKKDA